ncbi:MAG: RNA 2',3'-cyclic phosphodiesterase [Rubrivivax sp.]|nr:RNA 2',3'-cyclic phosphodiesterase [Rubrivivax sp.]
MTDTAASSPTPPLPPTPTRRLFTALWPDDDTRARFTQWRSALGWPAAARPISPAKLHLTLHFIGAWPEGRLEELKAALPPLRRPFVLHLEMLQAWKGGLVVLTPRSVPAQLEQLFAEQALALRRLGATLEDRPYRPHLSLARDCRLLPSAPRQIDLAWNVQRVDLVESRPDGAYQTLASAPGP